MFAKKNKIIDIQKNDEKIALICLYSYFQIVSTLALLSVVSAGHLGNYQSSAGYNAFGAGAYNPGSASAYNGGYGAHIPILRYENVNNGDGTYRYRYY